MNFTSLRDLQARRNSNSALGTKALFPGQAIIMYQAKALGGSDCVIDNFRWICHAMLMQELKSRGNPLSVAITGTNLSLKHWWKLLRIHMTKVGSSYYQVHIEYEVFKKYSIKPVS